MLIILKCLLLQEDLTVEDTNAIFDDLLAGRKPAPGPGWVHQQYLCAGATCICLNIEVSEGSGWVC